MNIHSMSYFNCKRVKEITLAHPKIQIIPSFTPFLGQCMTKLWDNCRFFWVNNSFN